MQDTYREIYRRECASTASARFAGKFCPQGDTRGKEFLPRGCAQKWVPPRTEGLLHQRADGVGVGDGVVHRQALDQLGLGVEDLAVLLDLAAKTGWAAFSSRTLSLLTSSLPG